MKKTQRKELLRTITAYPLMFFLLVSVVGISVALFCGLEFLVQGMSDTADTFYKDHQFFGFRVESLYGFQEEALDPILEIDEVTEASLSYEADAYLTNETDGNLITARFFSQPDGINLPTIVEGELPTADGTCAIELMLAQKLNLNIGDTISLAGDGAAFGLEESVFTICGIVELPQALVTDETFARGLSTLGSGQTETLVIVPESSFTAANASVVWVRTQVDEEVNLFTEEYTQRTDSIRDALMDLDPDNYIVYGIDYNDHYTSFQENLEEVEKLIWSSALVLLILGSLICMTIMDRMISDRRREIGIQKALGFRPFELYKQYGLYCAIAVFLGVLVGALTAEFIAQNLFWVTCYVDTNWFQDMQYQPAFLIKPVLLICGIEVGLNVLIALLSCRRTISSQAVALMRSAVESDTNAGAGIRGRFSMFPLQTRILFRGLFSNKRLLISVIGCIGACSVLIISVITARQSMTRVLAEQYDALQHYEYVVVADERGNIEEVQTCLESYSDDVLPVSTSLVSFEDAEISNVTQIVCQEANLESFFSLTDIETGEELSQLPETGMLVSRKLSEELDVSSGDSIQMTDIYGNSYEVQIAGIYEWYLGHQVLMSSNAYLDMVGAEGTYAQFFVNLNGETADDLREELRTLDAFVSLKSAQIYRTFYEHEIESIVGIVLFACAAAVLITLFVVFNLASMNLEDKKKELIIMGSLGFRIRTRIWAAMSDILLVSLIGLVLGAVIGAPLGVWLSKQLEASYCQNYRHISWYAIAVNTGICFVTVLVANLATAGRIRSMRLSERTQ
ncbi:MAG: ABC transporter permease [Oscillospiraceae bacterium]|nr:ABC transporter permease [Oscillospiraceae bacterium]